MCCETAGYVFLKGMWNSEFLESLFFGSPVTYGGRNRLVRSGAGDDDRAVEMGRVWWSAEVSTTA